MNVLTISEKNIKRAYNIVPVSINKYATLPCQEAFQNTNFDDILVVLGENYYGMPNASINQICALIKDQINQEWHLNRKRNHDKKISTKQIKSIRRSFNRIVSNNNYVRIPFDVVSIFFFILSLLKSIETPSDDVKKYINNLNRIEVGEYLYKEHRQSFKNEYEHRIRHLRDNSLREKYETLHSMLVSTYTIMTKKFNEIEWHKIDEYKL